MRTGRIISVELSRDGTPLYTIKDSGQRIYYPCMPLSITGGMPSCFSSPSIDTNSSVVFTKHDSVNVYYIVGFIPDIDDLDTVKLDGVTSVIENEKSNGLHRSNDPDVKEQRDTVLMNEDYTTFHINDFHLENAASFLNLSSVSGITMQGFPKISMQLNEGGKFRVSMEGVAGNKVLNANPFLNKLFAYIDSLEAKVNAMSTFIEACTPLLSDTFTKAIAEANAAGNVAKATDLSNKLLIMQQASVEIATPLPIPSTQAKTDCQSTINSDILIP
jgi:hypothetical protein